MASGGSTLGLPPQIVASPPPTNLAVLLTHCDQLILRKISKFDAISCQILRLKCAKFDFRWGCAPNPPGGAYSTPPEGKKAPPKKYFGLEPLLKMAAKRHVIARFGHFRWPYGHADCDADN